MPKNDAGQQYLEPCADAFRPLRLRGRAKTRIDIVDIEIMLVIEISSIVITTVSMIPSYRVFGANRVSRRPSLLIACRVQKRQPNAVPLAPASKERLQKDSTIRRDSLRLAACLAVSVLTGPALSLHRRAGRIAACIYDPEFRHQRNLSHRDSWQQHHRKLGDSGHQGLGFGSQFGILRAVGSYETQSSSPYDFGYLYDGAAGPNRNLNAKGANPVHDSSQHIRQPDRIRSPIGQSAEKS
jgi:hypothetical protein